MKKIYLSRFLFLCSLCLTLSTARAQYVAIPDSNFGNWLLNSGYSSCLMGNSVSGFQLDTTCSIVTSATSVSCFYSNISDLTGIQYFHHLTYLYCDSNHLTALPPLPSSLITLSFSWNRIAALGTLPSGLVYLNCSHDTLLSLPALPAGLVYLNCDHNQLTGLPALPSSLRYLSCTWNQIASLPALPSGLTSFYVYTNQLTSLPALPANLDTLSCDNNLLASLPALPSALIYLTCSINQIRTTPILPASLIFFDISDNPIYALPSLPMGLSLLFCSNDSLSSLPSVLPSGLTNLYCVGNELTALPAIPSSLYFLGCSWNQLTSLPFLPDSLVVLWCEHNLLTALPTLPNQLQILWCGYNPLTSLPAFPQSFNQLSCIYDSSLYCLPQIPQNPMQDFYIAGTSITCLPNSFTAYQYDIRPDSLPLCGPSSGCDFFYNIAGTVHSDTSANCMHDSLYPGSPITNMKVQLIENGQVVQQFYTFTSGNYSFKVDTLTNYTVSVDTTWLPLSVVCPASDSQYVSLSLIDSVAIGVNFGMVCSNFDYGVGYICGHHFRPTFTSVIQIGAGNMARVLHSVDCGSGMPGTVTTTLGGSITYVSPAPGAITPTSVSGNVLTYNMADLDSLTLGSIDIIVQTDTGAIAGTDACFTTVIIPSTPDMNPYDDALTQCFTIVHSWDPNSKSVTPKSILENKEWLNYTIEFQNTGTDTAYTVVVRDTLSPYVDASTFQFMASSSKVVVQLFGNAMVFTFPKINLVDSATNAPLSVGWIQYKVKAKDNLPLNTQVNNTAYVYFDQNPAVVTNTAVSTINFTGIIPVLANNTIHLYPNPNKGTFTLETSNSINSTYTIMDMLGHIITQQTISSDKQTINMSAAADGVYTLMVRGAKPQRFTVVR